MSIDRAKALKSAQKYMAKGQLDRAIVEYERVVALDPKDPRSLLKLGDLYTRVGDSKNAVATYRKVAIQYGDEGFFLKAVAVYKQILKLEPENLDAWERLGEMYEALSLASDAVATFEQVAEAALRTGRQDIALRALARVSELEPENVAATIRHAESLSKADRIDEAIVAFRRGADLLKHQGRLDDFIKVTERLLFHSHEDIDRARELAALYLQRDRTKQALSHLQTCFKHDPHHPGTLALLAQAFERLGQSGKAASVYRELAHVHASKGEIRDELLAWQRLLAFEPTDAEANRRCEVLQADDEELIVVDEASNAGPMPAEAGAGSPELLRLLSEYEVFERYGLRDPMRAQLERMISIAPERTDLREKLAALADPEPRASAPESLPATPVDDDEVMVVDDDDEDAAVVDLASHLESGIADEELDDDEPELVLDEEGATEEELLTEDDLIASESLPPPGPGPSGSRVLPEAEESRPERVTEALEEADFYLSQQLFEEARETLFDALGDHPGHPILVSKLRSIDDLEATEQAGSAPSTAPLAEAPDDQSFALAEKLAAEVTDTQQLGSVDVSDVVAQFRAGVEKQVEKSDAATHYDLGIAYMEMGLHSEAIDEFKLCLEVPGKECTAHTMIGLSYVSQGDMPQAIDHFKRALESEGLSGEAELDLWFEIGNANELLAKASEALVWYEKVEERKPDFRDVAQRIERLGVVKTKAQETDEFDAMFDNMILKE